MSLPLWKYRRPITVTNNVASVLTNFQILITIDTAALIAAGKMQSGGQDIRFLDADDSTSLSYWIQSGINTTTTKIWIKVPSLTSSQVKDIYMYYGNSTVAAASSISNTFVYGDDFSTNTIANYTTVGTVSVDTTNRWMLLTGINVDNTFAAPTTQTNPTSYIVEAEVAKGTAIGAGDNFGGLAGFKSTLTGGDGYIAQFGNLTSVQKIDIEKYQQAHLVNAAITFSDNTFYPIKGTYVNANITVLFNNTTSTNSTDSSYTSGKYGMRAFNNDVKIQNFRVREYASTEPSISLGTEGAGGLHLSESVTFTPNVYKDLVRNLSENPTFTPTVFKETIRTLSETVTFTETLIRDMVKNLTETVTFTTNVFKDISRSLIENATFIATLSRGFYKTLFETATFTISFLKRLGRTATNWIEHVAEAGGFSKQTPTSSSWNKHEPTEGDWH